MTLQPHKTCSHPLAPVAHPHHLRCCQIRLRQIRLAGTRPNPGARRLAEKFRLQMVYGSEASFVSQKTITRESVNTKEHFQYHFTVNKFLQNK